MAFGVCWKPLMSTWAPLPSIKLRKRCMECSASHILEEEKKKRKKKKKKKTTKKKKRKKKKKKKQKKKRKKVYPQSTHAASLLHRHRE